MFIILYLVFYVNKNYQTFFERTIIVLQVIFPNLEKLKLSSINIEKIWHDQYPLMLNSCSQNLTNLTVETCSRLKFLFSYSMVDSLVRLQQLEIRKCESMEAVIDTTDIEINSVEFPSLHHLRIVDCPNLRSFISVNSSEEKILHTDMQPLFDEKVLFLFTIFLPLI